MIQGVVFGDFYFYRKFLRNDRKKWWKMLKERHRTKSKRLRPIPLITGIYGFILGLGLTVIGIADLAERMAGVSAGSAGIVRCIAGFVLVSFGMYGIWDGIRDVIKPQKDTAWVLTRQFILTDADGKRSSHVSREVLQAQLSALVKKGEEASISLQILPPILIQGLGQFMQVSYFYCEVPRIVAFFVSDTGEYLARQRQAWPPEAEAFLEQFLVGVPDFSRWEEGTVTVCPGRAEGQSGRYLRIFGESWVDEHKFFSARDLELAAEGLSDGKYISVELGLEGVSLRIFSGTEERETVIMQIYVRAKGGFRTLVRKSTVTQAKFWLVKMFHEGPREALSGWQEDIFDSQERHWQ